MYTSRRRPNKAEAEVRGPDGARLIAIGRLGRPHGVRGEIRLDPAGTMPRGLKGYDRFFVAGYDGAVRPLKVAAWRTTLDAILVAVEGVSDRDSVGELTGLTIYVDRADMPDLPEGEYYHADLLGLKLVDRGGGELGLIEDVKPWGDYDMLSVRTGRSLWMLPLIGQYVVEIKVAEGLIVADVPEGLGP